MPFLKRNNEVTPVLKVELAKWSLGTYKDSGGSCEPNGDCYGFILHLEVVTYELGMGLEVIREMILSEVRVGCGSNPRQ